MGEVALFRQQTDGGILGDDAQRAGRAAGEILIRAARAAALVWLLAFGLAWAAASFPALTGRVVDDAHVLSPVTKANLETRLADLEKKSSIQLVVATVPTLGGEEIEPYANALFRHWKLGQADKNNGVLFLIAPKQHRMRIEVGYGLEGVLTDAISKVIISNAAAPRFKAGDYDGGVTRAVDDIVTALTTDTSDWKPEKAKAKDNGGDVVFGLIVFLVIVFFIWRLSRHARRTCGAWIVPMNTGGWSSGGGGGGWSSGGSDGGFSGGGGSSGGGGASGDW